MDHGAPGNAVPPRASLEKDTYRRPAARVGRNEPCPCGSGRKFKHCCLTGGEPTVH